LPSVSFERSIATRVIKLGADFAVGASAGTGQGDSFAATFPELAGLRYLLAVGTIEPRKNHLGTWLAGSPRPTSFDRGMRNTWHSSPRPPTLPAPMRATCREIDPVQPAFENYYPQNYETASWGSTPSAILTPRRGAPKRR
jgi:hypothetical protein